MLTSIPNKRTPPSDTMFASLEPESKIYRGNDGNDGNDGNELYFRKRPTSQKS